MPRLCTAKREKKLIIVPRPRALAALRIKAPRKFLLVNIFRKDKEVLSCRRVFCCSGTRIMVKMRLNVTRAVMA